MYKLIGIFLITLFYNQNTNCQTHSQRRVILNFYEDLYNSDKDAKFIAQEYLSLKQPQKDINERLKIIQELIDGFRKNKPNENKIFIKKYKNIMPTSYLIVEEKRQKDVFVIQNDNKILLNILLKKNKIESFSLLTKGGRRSFFMTY